MKGLMQQKPLYVNDILDFAASYHKNQTIIGRLVEGGLHTQTYAQTHHRAKQLSQALKALGFGKGDVIATLGWNTHRHFESWYGICGIGGIYHTLNPRLAPPDIAYIINHADDKLLFLDTSFLPLVEALAPNLKNIQGFIVMTDKAHMPTDTKLNNIYCYEELLSAQDGDFQWQTIDENDACGICYTSGTTGKPKGVVYSHRSNVLHALAVNLADVAGLKATDIVMPVVPMFHANAWGMTFAAPMVGARIVNPAHGLDPKNLYTLLDEQKITLTAAVPTIWAGLLAYIKAQNLKLPHLERLVIGGSAVSRPMLEAFERDYKVSVRHAWGMTETSPLGTIAGEKMGMDKLDFASAMDMKEKQGRPPFMIDLKITNDKGEDLPCDGKTAGHLKVKGHFVASAYLKGEGGQILDEEGFFGTGDIATIDEEGYMQITDREKDIIKSGGEWISSIEIENLVLGLKGVKEAAVIAIPHDKWDERPLLLAVLQEGINLTKKDFTQYLEGKIAKWWMPDDVVFVDELPYNATGKVHKRGLREQYKNHKPI